MKKLVVFALVASLLFSGPIASAYDLTQEDQRVIQDASYKIEKVILQKGKTYRAKYLTALERYRTKYANNERLSAIILGTIARVRMMGENVSEPSVSELFPVVIELTKDRR